MDWFRLLEVVVAAAVAVGYIRARLEIVLGTLEEMSSKLQEIDERLRRLELFTAFLDGRLRIGGPHETETNSGGDNRESDS